MANRFTSSDQTQETHGHHVDKHSFSGRQRHPSMGVHSFNEYMNEYPEAGPLVQEEEDDMESSSYHATQEDIGDDGSRSESTRNRSSQHTGRVNFSSLGGLGSIFGGKKSRSKSANGTQKKNANNNEEQLDEEEQNDPYLDRDISLLGSTI